jgi:ABC-type spermidine/putrescine transport system permease subunit II
MRERDRGARILLLLALAPFALGAGVWLFHLEGGGTSAGPRGAWEVLARSLVVAGGGAAVATVAGAALGTAIAAHRIPLTGACAPLWLAPLLLPSVVVTTAAQAWLADGPLVALVRGEVGAVLLHGAQLSPLVLWGVARSLAAIPAAELHAARVALAPPLATRLLAGRAAPVALRLGILSFLLLLPRIEVPAYTGIETIGTRALAAFTAAGSDLEGWLWCALCLAISAPLLPLAAAPLASPGAPAALGRRDPVAPRSSIAASLALGAALIPLIGIVGLAIDALGEGIAPARGEGVRWLAALAAELPRVLPLALGLALVGWRISLGVGRAGIALSALPLVLPGALPALILLEGALPWIPRPFAAGTLPLDLAQAVRFLGVAVLLGRLADRSLPAAERAAAALLPPPRRRFRVLLPRAAGAIAASAALLAALLLGEVESAALVVPPGRLLPAVELHQLLHYRYDVQAARLSLALAAATGILVLLVGRIGRERPPEGER